MLRFVGSRRLRHSKRKQQYKDELDILAYLIGTYKSNDLVLLCYLICSIHHCVYVELGGIRIISHLIIGS